MPPRNRTIIPIATALAGAMLSLAGATARADDWATPGLDAAHGRLSSERSGAVFSDGRWSAAFLGGARVLASPVVADGFVVTVDIEGAVHALRAESGQVAWQIAAGSAVQGTPAITHGRVFVPTVGNKLVALRLGDGKPLWTRDLGGMMLSSPTPVNDDIVLAAGFPERRIVRLAGATGEIVWQSPPVIEQLSNTSPAVGGGLVVVGSNGGRYYAFDLVTGALRWTYAADGIVHLAAPIIVGGRVYMAGGNDSNRVHAIDAATGSAVLGWPIDLPTPDPDVSGTRRARKRAVSSFASVAGLLLIETRLDDALDTNADGVIDETLSREIVVALDPSSGAITWQHALARAEIVDPNNVPKFFVCPTPAAFGTDGGLPLVAVASSLDAVVVVLDVASGAERARHVVAGAALGSPVISNGRLITAGMNGTVQSLGSSVNHAPTAPILAANSGPLDAGDVVLRWLPAVDADGELSSYELRIDGDGELLESWQQQIFLASGVTSTRITAPLVPGVSYTFALRARDNHGALSPWSAPEGFTVVQNPTVTIGGTPATSLGQALGAAQQGDVIVLQPGTYALSGTLSVRGGVSIQGAGAGRTTLDASGLGVGISFDGTSPGRDTNLDGVTVTGADTCVRIGGACTGVRLSHVIVRDCRVEGVAILATGSAAVVNATLVGNGTAIHAAGATTIKDSLVAANGVALVGDATGTLASSYNDLFGNQTDYSGLSAGTGDLSTSVTFADLSNHDLRILNSQASTDKGDPGDAVGPEPAPNGGRINLGAFGGTADAEKSAPSPSTLVGGAGPIPSPLIGPVSHEQSPGQASDEGGCVVGGHSRSNWEATLVLAALAARRRRGQRR